MYSCTDLQTLVGAKKSLTGLAMLWLESQRKLPNESFKEYLLQIRSLGSRRQLSDRSVIKYVIAGINDSESNKAMLYGKWTIDEFKRSLEDYQLMKERISKTEKKKSYSKGESSPKDDKEKKDENATRDYSNRCFNCGGREHQGKDCRHKVAFEVCHSPAVFQRYIPFIFKDLIREGSVLVYLHDVVIIARDEDEAIKNLERVLDLTASYSLEMNWKKCPILQKQVEYLGHIVEGGTTKPSPEKVAAVRNFPEPKNKKMIMSFLGLAGYMCKFIEGFTWITKPLREYSRDDVQFYFGEEQRRAFQTLKQALCEKPVLRIFDPNLKIEVHTNASIDGYGTVSMQKCEEDSQVHPCFYFSQATSDVE